MSEPAWVQDPAGQWHQVLPQQPKKDDNATAAGCLFFILLMLVVGFAISQLGSSQSSIVAPPAAAVGHTPATDPRIPAMRSWARANLTSVDNLRTGLARLTQAATDIDLAQLNVECHRLRDTGNSARSAMLPTPDAELSASVTDLLDHIYRSTTRCIQFLNTGLKSLLVSATDELAGVAPDFRQMTTIMERYAAAATT